MTFQPMFIAVSPSLGVSSLPQLIELAKKKPGELSYATTGRGRITHMTMDDPRLRVEGRNAARPISQNIGCTVRQKRHLSGHVVQ